MAKGMLSIDTEITGWPAIHKQLEGLETKSQKKVLRKALRAAGKIVLRDARAAVPVRTGNLKKNTKLSVSVSKKEATASVGPNADAYYGRFIEMGTSSIPAQPFLRPALEDNQRRINEAFADALQSALNEVARG